MADLAVGIGSSVISTAIDMIFNRALAFTEQRWFAPDSQLEQSLKKLQTSIPFAKGLILDAEKQAHRNGNEGLKAWVAGLRNVVYDVEDTLDELEYMQLKQKVQRKRYVPRFLRHQNVKVFERVLTTKINDIQKRIEELSQMANIYKLEKSCSNTGLPNQQSRITTSFLNDEIGIFGRDDIRDEIIDLLTKEEAVDCEWLGIGSSDEKTPVLTICGMGGIGKTTIAQMVCNHVVVKSYFESNIIWVCVSDDFDVRRIVTQILEVERNKSMINTPDSTNITSQEVLEENLNNVLKRRRYLLILDDVWNEDPEKWHQLSKHFRIVNENKGSKVLVTTRKMSSAEIMSQPKLIKALDCLPDEVIKSLFAKIVFNAASGFDNHPQFQNIGGQIIAKLKGSPLAAKTVGHILRSPLSISHWEKICQSDFWEMRQDDYSIMPALRISYQHLPEYLKPCFTFCSIYPKDYIYDTEDIVEMWIALGFVHQKHHVALLEDIGEEYVNELLNSSMFLAKSEKKFMIHDLIHDLAKMESKNVSHAINSEKTIEQLSGTIRYLSIYTDDINWEELSHCKCLANVRALVCLHKEKIPIYKDSRFVAELRTFLQKQLPKMKWLRVLDLSYYLMEEFPVSFRRVKHLRYLNLRDTSMKTLRSSLKSLYHLQVLDLMSVHAWVVGGIRNLINLRHIRSNYNIGRAQDYEKTNSIQDFSFIATDEYGLKILKGKKEVRDICIYGLQHVEKKEAFEVQLKEMRHLRKLKLRWEEPSMSNNEEEVLDALEPNPNITELRVYFTRAVRCPIWMGNSSFVNLQRLYLDGLLISEVWPPFNKLENLKILELWSMKCRNNLSPSEQAMSGPSVDECQNQSQLSSFTRKGWLPCTLYDLTLGGIDFLTSTHLSNLKNLTSLRLNECRNIQQIPHEVLGALGDLIIGDCEQLVVDDQLNLPRLGSLWVQNCPKAMSESRMPHLSSLCQLILDDCEDLQNVIPSLTSIMYLNVTGCAAPRTSTKKQAGQELKVLKSVDLETRSPRELKEWLLFFKGNTSLKEIWILRCDNLQRFDEETQDAIREFVSVSTLGIMHLPDLETLPDCLRDLPSLREINISKCPKLKALPEFPATLQALHIWSCPLLKERYKPRRFTSKRKEISRVGFVEFRD